MKKVSLVLGMVLAASFAMAQNTALVEQIASGGKATVSQTGTNNVTVRQLDDQNTATVNQKTTGNVGFVLQLLGTKNTATLIQDGQTNKANLYQGIIAGYAQSGTDPMAASKNTGYVRQVGNNNDVYDFFQLGDENTGSVDISGNSNRVEFQQGFTNYDSGEAVLSDKNHSSVIVTGSSNFAGMWQWGDENTSNITQTGSRNKAAISQGYSYQNQGIAYVPDAFKNTSNVSQIGSDNNVRAMQLGDNNTLSLTQNGDFNKVGGMQGTGLATYFRQTGDGNIFTGVQSNGSTLEQTSGQIGNLNEIDMVQGTGDIAKIIQDGNLNDAFLTQGGGVQNATILQDGNSNTASVSQGL